MRITTSMMHNTHALLQRRNQAAWGNGMPPTTEERLNTMLLNAAGFVHNAGPRATNLRNTLNSIPAVVDRQIPITSDVNVMRIRSHTGQNVPETEVNVIQLAQTQRNEGTALPANETAFEPGAFRFEIEIDGETHSVSFTTTTPLNNRAFQQRMAQAINQSPVGVNATVINGPNGTSQLNLEAAATGAGEDDEPRFIVRDVQGEAVATTGIDTITREGMNALFTVNDGDEPQSSASNDVTLPGNVQVTLAGAGDATITAGRDVTGTVLGVRQMVSDINAFLQIARSNPEDNRTRALVRNLETQLRRNGNALRNIGITTNNHGVLVLDETRLREATESGATGRALGTQNNRPNAFINNLQRTADSVARNPIHHINQRVSRTPGFAAALNAVRNPAAVAQQVQPSPFDAYFAESPWGSLWNGTS